MPGRFPGKEPPGPFRGVRREHPLTPLDRLRAALVLRRQRAWDTERDGPEPSGPEMPLTVRSIIAAAGWLVLLGLALWVWLNR